MNDISKFNNKYLKCIITKYKSTVNTVNGYLANSGALIIYHPDNENDTYTTIVNGEEINTEYNRNYIYLGNEFLASGYGFLCKDMRDDAERIIKNFDKTIKDIKNNIQTEKNSRILEDTKIREELNNYIKHDGFIDNTKVNINGKVINTKDILLHGEEAKYENLEITNIKLNVNVGNKQYSLNDNNIYLPLGISISSIEIIIEYNINDSGGIDKLEVLHKYDTFNNLNLDEENENIQSVIIKYDQDNNGNATEGVIKYKKIFSEENGLNLVTDKIEDFIQGFYIYVKETPKEKYKSYPRIKEYFDIDIPSTGNMIINNVIQLFKHINIIPLYSIHYAFTNNSSYESIKSSFEKSYELLTDINNEIKIDVSLYNNSNYKIFYFAIPSIYSIDKLYAIDYQNNKYDWTGSVFIGQTTNAVIYKNAEYSCIYPYTFYRLSENVNNINIGFACKQIILNISLINNVLSYDQNKIQKRSNNNLPNISLSNFNLTINDEDFNNLYWVLFNDRTSSSSLTITNTLNPLKNNGTTNI